MDFITIKDENDLELTVTTTYPKNCNSIIGGMDISPSWEEYLSDYKEEFKAFGNNVYAFSIPLPIHRDNHSGISVELLSSML